MYVPLDPVAAECEASADRLLRRVAQNVDAPFYTEPQLARHDQSHIMGSLDTYLQTGASLLMANGTQSAFDELRGLIAMTPLTRRERCCLNGWLWGWTQAEIAREWQGTLQAGDQQRISRCLLRALRKCCQSDWVSFAQFSRHSIYRRPPRRRR